MGPVPDIYVHNRNWKKVSNPLATFKLKVSHCMQEQYVNAKVIVRKGDIHKLHNFKVSIACCV